MSERSIPEDGWSEEGGAWFNSLDWEDAQSLLTRQGDDPPTEDACAVGARPWCTSAGVMADAAVAMYALYEVKNRR